MWILIHMVQLIRIYHTLHTLQFNNYLNQNPTQTPVKLKMDSTTTTANLGIKPQKIVIKNNYGEKLVGLLHETGSKEVVIVCHGFHATKEYSMMVDFCVALEKHGISAFRFDFSGNGESEGLPQRGFRKEVDDLKAVIQHFSEANRVVGAIIGHSKAGSEVILYASSYHDIKTVVNVSGRYNMDRFEEFLGKDYLERLKKDGYIDIISETGELLERVTEESVMEVLNTNMHEAGLKVDQDCSVLTVHGSADETNPVSDALAFAKVIRNHELRIIEGANHDYTNHRDQLVSAVLDFFKTKLKIDF